MRYFVLVTYDVADEKRLRLVFKMLRGYGEHVQYSVFLCQLTPKDQLILSDKLSHLIHHKEDQVIMITLGPTDGQRDAMPKKWNVLGLPLDISDHSIMVY